jgi:DNA-binding CsgD family transcriptional regulator
MPMRPPIVLQGFSAPTCLVRIVPAAGAVIVGRSPRCDLVIDHLSVSRRHARVTRGNGSYVQVADLGSRNGTFVDEVRVGEAVVPCGRKVRFGAVTLLVCEQGEAPGDDESSLETDGAPCREQRSPPGVAPGLTEAQRTVFGLLGQGLSEKAIARRLGISVHTAHNHICAIYKSLRVHSRAELMARLLQGQHAGASRAVPPPNGGMWARVPANGQKVGLKLYYTSSGDHDTYHRLLNDHGIACSDQGGYIRIDSPVTPEVMRVLATAVLQ